MVFSSPLFLFLFLPLCLIAYLITNIFGNTKAENICLLIFSILFYAYGNLDFLPLLLISIVVNFILSKFIELTKKNNKQLLSLSLLTLAVTLNLGMLFIFKYMNLFSRTFFGEAGATHIVLPIGISFYTFQVLSYIVDVYRGDVSACNSIIDCALFTMLFPQLIAGPIVRYSDIESEMKYRRSNFDDVAYGIMRFMVGFTKKILFANSLAKVADLAFAQLSYYYMGPLLSALVIVCYSMQIYLDFSGYSDMAIGIGRIFGFHFLENFNNPFTSKNITEFWRRWHISLSSFFKDYVYIPLGGSKKGKLKTYINLFIVFTLSGFWHGASFNFLIWGIYNGIFIVIERIIGKKWDEYVPNSLGVLYTFVLWNIGMIFFRLETLNDVMMFVSGFFKPAEFNYLTRDLINEIFNPRFILIFIISVIYLTPFFDKANTFLHKTKFGFIVVDLVVVILFIYSNMVMLTSGFNPFIYFKF